MQALSLAQWPKCRRSAKTRRMSGPESIEEIGKRLRWTREALGFNSQVGICRDLGDENLAQAWNNWERGRDRIAVENAIMLVRKYRLTLDWIYLGDDRRIEAEVAREIEKIRKRELEPASRPARRA